MIQLSQREIDRLYTDPVMAAEVLMGAKLDTFQKCRLRYLWWVPEVTDNSGVGTGKSEVVFIYIALRCLLIPDHHAAIYFPTFQIGKDVFWPKWQRAEERSEIFRAQFERGTRKQDEDKANLKSPGTWMRTFKNGSKVFMSAPNFKGDSQNQASRDYNTVVIDDYIRCADQGDGIDAQLVDRARRPSWNKNHPIWCNHIKFLSHAESPTHKEFKRYRAFQKAIRKEGSPRHALITFNYEDWSPEMAKRYREDNVIASQKRKLSKDRFMRQYKGVWMLDGEEFYPELMLAMARKNELVPQLRRRNADEMHFLGQDTAQPTVSRKSDWSAWVDLRAIELPNSRGATAEVDGRFFHLSVPYAYQARRKAAPELAAFTHRLHRRFLFNGICLDPGGGGLFVLPELRKTRHLIGNVETECLGLTTMDDPLRTARIPIVSIFARNGDIGDTTDAWFMRGDEGQVEYFHNQLQECVQQRGIVFPREAAERDPRGLEAWPREARKALDFIDMMVDQLSKIRQLRRPDGGKLVNNRNYGKFEASESKKDLAMALRYAYAKFLAWLRDPMTLHAGGDGVAFASS